MELNNYILIIYVIESTAKIAPPFVHQQIAQQSKTALRFIPIFITL